MAVKENELNIWTFNIRQKEMNYCLNCPLSACFMDMPPGEKRVKANAECPLVEAGILRSTRVKVQRQLELNRMRKKQKEEICNER